MHKQVPVMIDGKEVMIDEKMVELIKVLNKVGLKTTASCQGNENDVCQVMISWEDVKKVTHSPFGFLIEWDNKKLLEEE